MPAAHSLDAPLLTQFATDLDPGDVVAALRGGLIGEDAMLDGPFGRQPLVYADYAASGRALMQVERFILEKVLPYYANSHTEASFCGSYVTRLRREARAAIGRCCSAGDDHAVIFAGSGATAGINRLVNLFGITQAVASGAGARVIIGPYEHHSNILAWRESGAEIIEIAEGLSGGPDMSALDAALALPTPAGPLVCSFSAASNVTGIMADVCNITRRAKAGGAKMIWDYAGGGAYMPISMNPEPGAEIDAIVVSTHKFIGGPGASGVLVVRRDAVVADRPTWPGGGTVRFVSPTAHDYSAKVETREEAGTPNVIGDIRAALAFLVKEALGVDRIARRNSDNVDRAIAEWENVENLELLGSLTAERLPIFSFRIRDGQGGYVHHQLVTRILSDRFGIQARGGCACAGPYVHRLLGIGDDESDRIRDDILAGRELEKPGFCRLNFSALMSDAKVGYILDAVKQLAGGAAAFAPCYEGDPSNAIFMSKVA
ncbi:aminotransferase class V-fold PLP-dependent enzyme [Aquibium carbonis]|uniref:Aminotransferase class V-fold PLP-dependent enzyme n=1 Tax=Aquibium carbonis TaxID=2495581 RepID=A0A429Z329_9HYPH|nr:aminotransferase class V-fold PLP-dependent enzyme [Aquibium carbonis]RST88099.1 aminotransferase class V-fold PLP-dependent enzyme [Aquibium carbonis]